MQLKSEYLPHLTKGELNIKYLFKNFPYLIKMMPAQNMLKLKNYQGKDSRTQGFLNNKS